jgi:hypothetical protein
MIDGAVPFDSQPMLARVLEHTLSDDRVATLVARRDDRGARKSVPLELRSRPGLEPQLGQLGRVPFDQRIPRNLGGFRQPPAVGPVAALGLALVIDALPWPAVTVL